MDQVNAGNNHHDIDELLQAGNGRIKAMELDLQMGLAGKRIPICRPALQHLLKPAQRAIAPPQGKQQQRLPFPGVILKTMVPSERHWHSATPICRQMLTLANAAPAQTNSKAKKATSGT